jgi:ferredoxin
VRVEADLELCQGHSVCIDEAPEVFDVIENAQGYSFVKVLMQNPPESLRDKVFAACKYCPNKAIQIVEE